MREVFLKTALDLGWLSEECFTELNSAIAVQEERCKGLHRHALIFLSALGEEHHLLERVKNREQSGDSCINELYLCKLESNYQCFYNNFSGPKVKIEYKRDIDDTLSTIEDFFQNILTSPK